MAVIQPFFNPSNNPNMPVFAAFMNGFIQRRSATNMMLLQKYLEGADTKFLSEQIKVLEESKRAYIEKAADLRKQNATNKKDFVKTVITQKTGFQKALLDREILGTQGYIDTVSKNFGIKAAGIQKKHEKMKEAHESIQDLMKPDLVKQYLVKPITERREGRETFQPDVSWGTVKAHTVDKLKKEAGIGALNVVEEQLFVAESLSSALNSADAKGFLRGSSPALIQLGNAIGMQSNQVKEFQEAVLGYSESPNAKDLTKVKRLLKSRIGEILGGTGAVEAIAAQQKKAFQERMALMPTKENYQKIMTFVEPEKARIDGLMGESQSLGEQIKSISQKQADHLKLYDKKVDRRLKELTKERPFGHPDEFEQIAAEEFQGMLKGIGTEEIRREKGQPVYGYRKGSTGALKEKLRKRKEEIDRDLKTSIPKFKELFAKAETMRMGFETDVKPPSMDAKGITASVKGLDDQIKRTQQRIDALSSQRFALQKEHSKRGRDVGYFGPFKKNYLLDNPFVVKSSGERMLDDFLAHYSVRKTIPKGGPTKSKVYRNLKQGKLYDFGAFKGGIDPKDRPFVEQPGGRRRVYSRDDQMYKQLEKSIKEMNKRMKP